MEKQNIWWRKKRSTKVNSHGSYSWSGLRCARRSGRMNCQLLQTDNGVKKGIRLSVFRNRQAIYELVRCLENPWVALIHSPWVAISTSILTQNLICQPKCQREVISLIIILNFVFSACKVWRHLRLRNPEKKRLKSIHEMKMNYSCYCWCYCLGEIRVLRWNSRNRL